MENGGKQKKTVEQIYQKKTQLEHILLRPDTYIGSVQMQKQLLWVFDQREQKMVHREINFCPGLYKIFDEILVNASDNFQRDKSMDTLKIEVKPEENKISVWNNGKGIPVKIHKELNCYVPEMIFGQLLTSSNYDDDQKKVTGGRNGFGAKLANIFSTRFIVETADSENKLYYKQEFHANMQRKDDPIITPNRDKQDYTCITFYPDLKKFKMDHLDDDIVSLLFKRAYDIAGVTSSKVKVFLNGQQIKVKDFEAYCDLYLNSDENEENIKIVEKKQERWDIIASISDGQFQQVSFVNGICTSKGGTHVSYITDQLIQQIKVVLDKKNKKKIQIKPQAIKQHLWIFVNALIENPAFDSQTKETLNTRVQDFGSSVVLTDKFIKSVLDSNIVEIILSQANAREEAKMAKALGPGKKKSKLLGIPKLEDANDAGGRNSKDCTIILTEGDSAKSLALAGIEVVGRDKYGVFPLRGKFLNVREASHKQIMDNPEIQNLVKILGIQIGTKYEDTSKLRYGKLMIMTDQDHDGSHIKGLIINFIHHFWPSLLQINGFLEEFITPIIKATKGQDVRTFFTIPEYENWALQNNTNGWKIKYYKGLGTSTSKEAKEYFGDLDMHQIEFEHQDREDDEAIDLAFNKKKADARKTWLTTVTNQTFVDHSIKTLRYKDFINQELVLFSVADCARSIPNLCDGMKPGQRKILFSCFKRKLRQEIKVAQLSGYVAEHSAYHHGEVSLQQTIVNMAQNFVASNNINLLLPNGQFGTRLQGGKDSASARYIFTCLSPVTRTIFPEADDPVLEYLVEEGQSIEPNYYLPIIPMVLVNGAEGIGTGWSTFIPQFNPREIVENVRRLMRKEPFMKMVPWYKGYQGLIEPLHNERIQVTGIYNVVEGEEDSLEITELPIGKWTRDYKNFLEELASTDEIEEIREHHQENRVHFWLKVPNLQKYVEGKDGGIEKKFKLSTTISTSNYVLFDHLGQIKKYNSEQQIMEQWFGLREQLYEVRKAWQLAKLLKECEILRNKVRFIRAVVEEELRINKRKRNDIVQSLKNAGYLTISQLNEIQKDEKKVTVVQPLNDEEQEQANQVDRDLEEAPAGQLPAKEYDYLLSMPLWSLSEEKIQELQNLLKEKLREYEDLKSTHIYVLWERDLDTFLKALSNQEELDEKDRLAHKSGKADGGKRKKVKAGQKEEKKKVDKVMKKQQSPEAQKMQAKKKEAAEIDPSQIPLKDRINGNKKYVDHDKQVGTTIENERTFGNAKKVNEIKKMKGINDYFSSQNLNKDNDSDEETGQIKSKAVLSKRPRNEGQKRVAAMRNKNVIEDSDDESDIPYQEESDEKMDDEYDY